MSAARAVLVQLGSAHSRAGTGVSIGGDDAAANLSTVVSANVQAYGVKEDNEQQQDKVEEQGKVEDRHVGLGNLSDSASESYRCGFDGQV